MIRVSSPEFLGKEIEYVNDCLKRRQLSQGPYVLRLEELFAAHCGVSYAVAVSSGTTALHLAMMAHGVRPGMAVIVPALAYVAVANAVAYCGGTPVFCDVDQDTWNMSPAKLDEACERATTVGLNPVGVVPVHMYGNPADMLVISEVARDRGLWVVEDAAEAFGAVYNNNPIGSLGDAAVFSLYANKIVASGEGGVLVTDDLLIAESARLLRGQGMESKRRYFHSVVGYNYRMTEIQAAIAVAQTETYEEHARRRREIAATYHEQLKGVVEFQYVPEFCTASNWLVTVLLPDGVNRDDVANELQDRGVETRTTFIPLPSLPPYRGGSYPVASWVYEHALSLPTHSALSKEDVSHVCSSLVHSLRALAVEH